MTQTTAITGVDFVSIPVTDLDIARDFYGRVLDLPCSNVWQRGDAPAMGAEFEAGGVTLALVRPEALGRPFVPISMPIALRVENVAAAKQSLLDNGVTFVADDIDSGVCNMAYFVDPDGNALMLHHRYAPHPPRRDLREAMASAT
jgi:predicted enzyme related to lactoylglutathione lyase